MKAGDDIFSAVQWSLLLANLIIVINYIVALAVPWVEADLKIELPWAPIYIPVELGLVRCFSDMCSVKKEKGTNHQGPGGGGWPPGGGSSPIQSDGSKVLFQVASIFAVILLSIAILLALAGTMLEYARFNTRPDMPSILPLRLTGFASIACCLAVLLYLFITLAGLNGGHYEVGFWLSLSTAVIAGVLSFGQLLINKQWENDGGTYTQVYLPSHVQTTAQQQHQARPPPSAATIVAPPVGKKTYGSVS